ncbi:MAG: YwaF family protein [Firmicutes bacterium]|nr:YwaF family protein [Bacillota bacterium]MCL1953597.1 YwaF family protein [Bacillota bacterium]
MGLNLLETEVNPNMQVFGLVHILYVVVGLGLAIPLAIFVAKRIGWNKRVFLIAGVLIFLGEATRTLLLVEEGDNGGWYLSPKYLPVHLCAMQVFLIFALALAKKENTIKNLCAIMYPTLVAGAAMALLIPSPEGTDTFVSFLGFQFFASHSLLMFVGIYMYLTRPVKFDFKTYGIAIGFMAVSLIGALYLNAILGGAETNVNYWFVAYPPQDGLPLLNLDNGWGIYILNLACLTIILISLTYVPVVVSYFLNKNKIVENHQIDIQNNIN